jgi:hypothetical protein
LKGGKICRGQLSSIFKKQRALFNLLRSICAAMAACGSDTRNLKKKGCGMLRRNGGKFKLGVDAKVALSTTVSGHCWLQKNLKL